MNKITIISDVHGKYDKYHKIIRQTDKYPYTIQIGDFGFKYDTLKNVDSTKHLILPGNHDNYDICWNYPHFMGDYGNTVLNKIPFFYYRGAYSIDRQHRTIGIDWWQDEQVTIDQFIKARELYGDTKPDIVIAHDCPDFMVPTYIGPYGRVYENITNWALGELYRIHAPKLYIHGHHHQSKTTIYGDTKFVCLDELETYTLDKENI
jgi:predicted phosphodiesterase